MGRAKELTAPKGMLQLKGYDTVAAWLVRQFAQCEPQTPSEWLGKRFPSVQERFGPAFLESIYLDDAGYKRITPISMNEDFIAGALGGDEALKHKVVFFKPESTFYFFDPRTQLFGPTSDEKLKLLASQLLVKCAQSMPASVDIEPLFIEFRTDESLRNVVKKAKALLAADASFFSPQSPYTRAEGPETHERLARMFIRNSIKPEPMKTLTVRECFELFCAFCKASGIQPVERRFFTPMVEDLVREEFSLNLRKDVLGDNQRMQRGWKGLSIHLADALAVERN
jgi:hypothetical protein